MNKTIIGTWSLSGDYGKFKEKDIINVLSYCYQKNFFEYDTAPNYGKGYIEKILSNFKKENNKKILINTKCGYNKKITKKNFSINSIKNSINRSLDLFDNLNLVMLHNPRDEIKDWEEIIDLFKNYKKKKLINFFGISLANNFLFNKRILNKFDYVIDEFNLLRSRNFKYFSELNNKFIARSIFANGLLSKNYINLKFQVGDHRYGWIKGQRKKNILEQLHYLKKIFPKNLNQYAFNYHKNFKFIDKVIIGINKKNHIDWILNQNSKKKLSKILVSEVINLNLTNKSFNNKYAY